MRIVTGVLFVARELFLGAVAVAAIVVAFAGLFVLPALIWIGLMALFLLAVIAVRLGRRHD